MLPLQQNSLSLLDGKQIRHEHQPEYLGVTLDRSLTFHAHFVKTAARVRSRNNLISKLAGSTWGARARTLRTATLALCCLVAEYCAPVWCCNTHTKLVDTQLNSAMRTISGSIMSTPVPWLPVLSNISPAPIRRKSASVKNQNRGENSTSPQPTSVRWYFWSSWTSIIVQTSDMVLNAQLCLVCTWGLEGRLG